MAERIITASSYVASGGLVTLGGLDLSIWFMGAGLVLAIATFAMNWVYKQKNYNMERNRRKDNG